MNRLLLEVCVASVSDAVTAAAAGADRLELNVGLEVGGLTPDSALVRAVRERVSIPVIVMIRPRAAGFCYSEAEQALMLRSAGELLSYGVSGVATGCLTDSGTIHGPFFQRMQDVLGGADLVCHRAFDLVPDQATALECLIDLRVPRVLTSGGAKTAWDGRTQLAALQQQAAGRIDILPGSGISADNVVPLLQETGCQQVHGSMSEQRRDPAGVICDAAYPATSADRVRAARLRLDEFAHEDG